MTVDYESPPSPYMVALLTALPLSVGQAAVLKLGGDEELTEDEMGFVLRLAGVGTVRRLLFENKLRRPYAEIWATGPRRIGKTTRVLACFGVSASLNRKLRKNLAPGERPAVFYSNVIKEKGAQLRNAARGIYDRLGVQYTMRDDAICLTEIESDFRPMVQNVQHASADSALMLLFDDLSKGQTVDGAKFDKHFVEEARPMLATTGGQLISFSQAWSVDGYHQSQVDQHHGKVDAPALGLTGIPSWEWVPEVLTREQCWNLAGGDKRAFQREWEGVPGANEDALLDGDEIRACTSAGVRERRCNPRMRCAAGGDLSARRDYSACSIGHLESRRLPNGEERTIVVEDRLLTWKPRKGNPLSPEQVVREMSEALRSYRVTSIAIDQWAFDAMAERFKHYGIAAELLKTDTTSQSKRAELFATRLRSRTIELLDDPEANRELARLRMKLRSNGLISYAAPQTSHDHDDRSDARFAMVERVQHAARPSGLGIREERRFRIEPGAGYEAQTLYLQKTKLPSGAFVEIPVAPPMGTELFDCWCADVLASGRATPETDARLRELYGDGVVTVAQRQRFLAEHDPRFPVGESEEADEEAPAQVPDTPIWRQTIERKIPRMT